MEFKRIKLGRLELNKGQIPGLPANPRKWARADVEALALSMKDTPELADARGAIVVPFQNAYVVLGGNMRREAASFLGWQDLMCAVLPEGTPVEKLKEIVLKDNSSFGAWDVDLLKADWGEFEFMDIGIKLPDLPPKGTKKARDDSYDPSRILGRKTGPRTKRGDLIQLGDHLLICADTKDVHALEKLMGGVQADLLVTDPPYNVAISNSAGKTIENDDMSDGAFRDFLYGCFVAASDCLKAGAACYIWMAGSEIDACIEAYEKAGLLYKQLLIWVKNSFTLGRQDYQWQHESCVYGWKPGAGHYFSDSRRESTVKEDKLDLEHMSKTDMKLLLQQIFDENGIPTTALHFDKPRKDDEHPTMKPVPLFGDNIQNSSRVGDIVLDPFGGSGTTLIACEQLGRRCRMVELDPVYCDVIVDRWEKYTGQKAIRP